MICQNIESLLGFACHPLNESGSVAMVETPFTFADGDDLPVFIEKTGAHVRFFDDHEVAHHFLGRGLRNKQGGINTHFITRAIQPYGLTLNDHEIEVWAPLEDAKDAFAKYIGGLMAVVAWEKSNEGVSQDIKSLVEEVSVLLQMWRPDSSISSSPEYQGVSRTKYCLDFTLDGEAVIVATPHPNSVGSALRKMVDIAGANQDVQFRVIIEDRHDKEGAKTQSVILSSMATVMPITGLVTAAGAHSAYALH